MESATREAEHQKIKADRDVAYQLVKAKTDAELETLTIHSEAAAAEAKAAVWEAADAMKNCLLLDETGPSEEDKIERTNNYIASPFDPNSPKSHPPPDLSAQTPNIAYQCTSQPPVNETACNPHNPFNQKSWMHVFQNDPSYSSNVHRSALNHDNFDCHTSHHTILCMKNLTEILKHVTSLTPAQPFYPQSSPTGFQSASSTEHLARYLARRKRVLCSARN